MPGSPSQSTRSSGKKIRISHNHCGLADIYISRMTAPEVPLRENSAVATVPRVVIVGGGFGGFYAARSLAKAPVQVTLVDKRNYHLFRPMLYQVATGLLSGDEIAPPLRVLFSSRKNIDVLMAEVTGIDTKNHRVLLTECELPYDYLILATGIRVNYFGHEEWKPIAPGLDALEDADKIRSRMLRAFEDAEQLALCGDADRDALKELLTFVLVGGAPSASSSPAPSQKWQRWRWHTTFAILGLGRPRSCCSKAHHAYSRALLRCFRRRPRATWKSWG